MSATSELPSNREWLRRLVSGRPHQIIGGPDDPYLRRWYLIPRNPFLNVYLHHFLRSDDDRALHDHPWWFVSVILKGEYVEVTEYDRSLRGRFSLAFRPAEWRHRVELLKQYSYIDPMAEEPCWTLVVTGRRSRMWGFWCKGYRDYADNVVVPDRFVPWTEFGDAGCGEP